MKTNEETKETYINYCIFFVEISQILPYLDESHYMCITYCTFETISIIK